LQKFKKGQKVMVISGKEKGKISEIEAVFPKKYMVVLKTLNIVKRHQKSSGQGSEGKIVDKAMPLNWSKVMGVDSNDKPSRKAKFEGLAKKGVAKKKSKKDEKE